MTKLRPNGGVASALAAYALWLAVQLFWREILAWIGPEPWRILSIDPTDSPLEWRFVAGLVVALLAALAFRWREGRLLALPDRRGLLLVVAPMLALLAMLGFVLWRTELPLTVLGPAIPQILVNAVVVALSQELMLRGVLWAGVRSRWPLWPAITATIALGALAPTGESFLPVAGQLAVSAAAAVPLMALRLRSGSLLPGIVVHALWRLALQLALLAGVLNLPVHQQSILVNLATLGPAVLYGLFLLRRVENGAPRGGLGLAVAGGLYLLGSGIGYYLMPPPVLTGTATGLSAYLPIDHLDWGLIGGGLGLALAALLFHRRDLGLRLPQPLSSLRLLWLPAIYVGAMLSAATAVGLPPASTIFYVAVLTVVVGFSEEIIFRGFAWDWLSHRLSIRMAIVVTSLAFGAVHVGNAVLTGKFGEASLQAVAAGMIGVLFLALRIRTASLLPAMLAHGAWDFSLIMVSLAAREQGGEQADDMSPAMVGLAVLVALPIFLYGLYLLRAVVRKPPLVPAPLPSPDAQPVSDAQSLSDTEPLPDAQPR